MDTGQGSDGDGAPRPALIDVAVPVFDAGLAEHVLVGVPVGAAWASLRALDLVQVRTPVLVVAFWLRGLPGRLRGGASPAPPSLVLGGDGAGPMPGWVRLGEIPGREIAVAAVGRFWTPSIEWRDTVAAAFPAFAEPGWGKIGVSWSVRPYGTQRTLATYECRVAITDAASRRRFARYWWLVRPFVRHVMRATLATLRASAERAGRPQGADPAGVPARGGS